MVVGSVLGFTTPAQAHNYLVSSTPTADSTLTELPDEFDITTNDNLLDTGGITSAFALQVKDADGRYYGDGCVAVAGPSMTTAPALGPAGVYTILWQVVSADGHTVSDEFTFTWAPTDETETSNGATSPPDCGGTTTAAAGDESDTPPANNQADDGSSDVLWIAGTVIALALTLGVTALVIRRSAVRNDR